MILLGFGTKLRFMRWGPTVEGYNKLPVKALNVADGKTANFYPSWPSEKRKWAPKK